MTAVTRRESECHPKAAQSLSLGSLSDPHGKKFASGLTAYRSEFELLVATTINGAEADIANCGPVCAIGQC